MVAVAALVLLVWQPFSASDSEEAGKDFAAAWEKGNYSEMYALLTPRAREDYTLSKFRRAFEQAAGTATATKVDTGEVEEDGDSVKIPVTASTRVFGPVKGDLVLPVSDGKINWTPSLTFPGVGPGETLKRESEAPRRASILSRDGETIVSGAADARAPEGPAASIAGEMGGPSAKDKDDLFARGFERDQRIGKTGLERALEEEVAGKPGGRLLVGERTLAQAEPRAARPVRSTIDSKIQQAAINALGARFGGVAALDPKTAEVRALAGVAFSAPQPPGSIFKIITTVAALEDGKVKMDDSFPVETGANIDGFNLANAHNEACGGTFRNSFAESCNSVFAPLGVKVGGKRLLEMAEKFGFNKQPTIPGAKKSTIPQKFTSDLDLGASAIGQGKILTTPLEMATMSQIIASRGVRREPTLKPGAGKATRVTTPKVARQLEELMIGVVEHGTGDQAQLGGGIKVAGKTGTAELGVSGSGGEESTSDTDAWFTAYAPIKKPQLVVAVLVVRGGFGGDVAAPIARDVLQAGIK